MFFPLWLIPAAVLVASAPHLTNDDHTNGINDQNIARIAPSSPEAGEGIIGRIPGPPEWAAREGVPPPPPEWGTRVGMFPPIERPPHPPGPNMNTPRSVPDQCEAQRLVAEADHHSKQAEADFLLMYQNKVFQWAAVRLEYERNQNTLMNYHNYWSRIRYAQTERELEFLYAEVWRYTHDQVIKWAVGTDKQIAVVCLKKWYVLENTSSPTCLLFIFLN